MRPRQPQLAKPHCLFEGDRAILIEKVIDIKGDSRDFLSGVIGE